MEMKRGAGEWGGVGGVRIYSIKEKYLSHSA